MNAPSSEIQEITVPDQIIASLRYRGKYSECGPYIGQVARKASWLIAGKPFCLYYDGCYKEDGADIEVCFPIRKRKEIAGLTVRDLPGGACLSLLHVGPYDELKDSYAILRDYVQQHGAKVILPTREVYHKGPGMIFRGNPRNYRTEILYMLEQ